MRERRHKMFIPAQVARRLSKATDIFRHLGKLRQNQNRHKRGHGLPEQKNESIIIGGQRNGKSFLFCEDNFHIATDDSGWIHIVPELGLITPSEIIMYPSDELQSEFRDGSHKYNWKSIKGV